MSSRLKDRGGGGGKIMASKPNKTPTESTPAEKKTLSRTAPTAGKENAGIVGKALSAAPRRIQLVPAVRRSTSSIPRGKSPISSDLLPRVSESRAVRVSEAWQEKKLGKDGSLEKNTKPNGLRSSFDGSLGKIVRKSESKLASDGVNRDPGSRVRVSESRQEKKLGKDGSLGNGGRVLEKNVKPNGLRSSFDAALGKIITKSASKLSSDGGNRNSGSRVRVLESCQEKKLGKDGNFGSEVRVSEKNPKPNGLRSSFDASLGKIMVETHSELNFDAGKGKSGITISDVSKDKASIVPCSKSAIEEEEEAPDHIKVFEIPNEKKAMDQVVGKYPSKLHEKLALLEGRVHKIASDIKRTKEMLEVNNQIESKTILSDIQKKISGIEKAVGCVMDVDGNCNESGLSEIVKNDSLQNENVASRSSCSAKGLNLVELEARFFPHQKLIKNRTSLNGSTSPIDENPIALEFLASLGTKSKLAAVPEMGAESAASSAAICAPKKVATLQCNEDVTMMASEKFEEFDDVENKPIMMAFEEGEDSYKDQMFEIGHKSSTAGWFVSEGEAVLLTHNDGSCSYYDIANCEEKAEYKPPEGVPNNLWNDCWLIRAPGADGCSGRYVVAASAGSTLESGFCSWDFYTKNVQAYLVDYGTPNSISMSSSRTALAPITNTGLSRRSISCSMLTVENRQWWYKPCGPLLISTASTQKTISAYDIRDGDLVMKWDVTSPVVSMEYSSPLQWRSRGKVIVAETEGISLWDVNSLTPQPLLSVASSGKKVACLHVNNTDAEIGGGVRQRVRSSEVEGNEGVFCTQDSINVFDFRLPSGVGLKISRQGVNAHSIFSCGDSIFIGTTEARLPLRSGPCSRVQQFSLRKGKLSATYALPDSNSHAHHSSITQVWGNSNFVMGICGMGLFVFDALKDESVQIFSSDRGNIMEVKEIVGPDDLYCPTFDYLASRILVVSRDRPAVWRYL